MIKEVKKIKIKLKNIIKFLLVTSVIIFPFIHINELIQMNYVLDSFENPDHYICIKSSGVIFASKIEKDEMIILQKSSHPDFLLNEKDYIMYFTDDGLIDITKIEKIKKIGLRNLYYNFMDQDEVNLPILKEQIIGKVLTTIDNNIINSISIKIWEISISNLNIGALIARN